MKTVTRDAELAHSPYTGATHNVLAAIVDMVDEKTGEVWFRQSTLAGKTRYSERTVRAVIKILVQDGFLEPLKRYRTYCTYRFVGHEDRSRPEARAGLRLVPTSGHDDLRLEVPSAQDRKQDPLKTGNPRHVTGNHFRSPYKEEQSEQTGEQTGEQKTAPASGGSDTAEDTTPDPVQVQDAGVAAGALPDDNREDPFVPEAEARREKRRKRWRGGDPEPEKGTYHHARWTWKTQARAHGIQEWNHGHLGHVLHGMAMDRSWEKVSAMVVEFFATEKDLPLKVKRTDAVRLFHQSCNNGLGRRQDDVRLRPNDSDRETWFKTGHGSLVEDLHRRMTGGSA